jgi:hypothetical protein
MIWVWLLGTGLLIFGIMHGLIGMILIGVLLAWLGMLGCYS